MENTTINNATEVVHFFNIKVYNSKPGDVIEFLSWSGLRFDLRMKHDWYFKYRAALLQVKHPRAIVECTWGSEPATGKTLEQILEQKRRAKRAKVTKYINLLQKARLNWSSLFPIEEDAQYQRAVAKIERIKAELAILNNR